MSIKVAGLMMTRDYDSPCDSLGCLRELCDHVIVLDHSSLVPFSLPADEIVRVTNVGFHHHVFTLLLQAAAVQFHCKWVVVLDDDMRFHASVTRRTIREEIRDATAEGHRGVTCMVRDLWGSENHYRSDRRWSKQRRIYVHANVMYDGYKRTSTNEDHGRLHLPAVPRLGPTFRESNPVVYHWGMMTPQLRQARYDRYMREDPRLIHQPFGYGHLLDETGLELTAADGVRPTTEPLSPYE